MSTTRFLNSRTHYFSKTAFNYIRTYIRTVAQGRREERTNKRRNMVSISCWLLVIIDTHGPCMYVCIYLYIYIYIYIYIRTVAQGGRQERTNKTQNMVSISWYLPEKVRDEMSKTQHF